MTKQGKLLDPVSKIIGITRAEYDLIKASKSGKLAEQRKKLQVCIECVRYRTMSFDSSMIGICISKYCQRGGLLNDNRLENGKNEKKGNANGDVPDRKGKTGKGG